MKKLTDEMVRSFVAQDKMFKRSDEKGLSIWIYPDGAKRWRYDYRFGGLRKTFAIGVYPEVSLETARQKTAEARAVLASGRDPMAEKVKRKETLRRKARQYSSVRKLLKKINNPLWAL